MLREEHVLDEIHCYRYRAGEPGYALVISHGIASHGAIYDVFCCRHAAKGVDIWSFDAPGHGKSTGNRPRGQWTMEEWSNASVLYAEHVRELTGLPVFTLGSSLGVAAAFSALHSEAVTGAILMGSPAVPGGAAMAMMAPPWRSPEVGQILGQLGRAGRLDCGILFNFDQDYGYPGAQEQKKMDPWNTWTYDLASWASLFQYDPAIPPERNAKPILVASGEKDPSFSPEIMKMVADSIAGPVEYYCLEGGGHQLMLFHTEEFSAKVHDWVRRHL